MSRAARSAPPERVRRAARLGALCDWLALLMLLAAGVVWPT
jgi:hypothetical protein